jgi:lipopolysaccharide transport system permease protein
MWMYASVLVPYSIVRASAGEWAWVYGLNPMAGVVEGVRWCLLRGHLFVDAGRTQPVPPPWELLTVGLPAAGVLLIFGLYYFKRMEKQFADIV